MDKVFLLLLFLTSIVGVTFIIERGLALRRKKVAPSEIESALDAFTNLGEIPMLRQLCKQYPSPLGRLILHAEQHREWPQQDNAEFLQTQARHEIVRLERALVFLEIIVGIAPLLGLVGTIFGLIQLFGGLGTTGMNDNSQVAAGIALALRATLMGLLTAIPALIAWSYYNKKVESLTVELELRCDQFMRRLYRYAFEAKAAPIAVVEKTDKPSKAEKAEKPDKAEKSEKIEKAEKGSERSEKAEKTTPKDQPSAAH